MANFGTEADLVARIGSTIDDEVGDAGARPLAILAGSGLTVGLVPSVSDVVNHIRSQMQGDDGLELDRRLAESTTPSAKYQTAFNFLSLRRTPAFRDRLITLCCLRSYDRRLTTQGELSPARLMEYEADVDRWRLNDGVAALGRLWTGLPSSKRGPLLTTNFDPLCEVAIRRAGGSPVPRILDADGAFLRDVQAIEVPQVVHLHGYWRESSTLSMTSQLDLVRPALEGSLRSLLGQYTLLVVGYAGWSDALTRQLVQVLREQGARDLDVLWCFFDEGDAVTQQIADNPILSQLLEAPGNISFYTGINTNSLFPTLERRLASSLQYGSESRFQSAGGALLDWTPVSSGLYRERSRAQAVASAVTFFDGRLPTWHDAASELVPRRDVVATILHEFSDRVSRGPSSLSLVTGPSGEGKTTALLQVAVEVHKTRPDVAVYFNGEGRLASVQQILSLPEATPCLLILDDAFRSAERLRALVLSLHEAARPGIHLLLGSRDTDWGSVGGFSFAWGRYLPTKTHRLNGMNRPDAVAIVRAWEQAGPEALGALQDVEGTEGRVSALMAAARDVPAADGAFLGALLQTRFGDGLRDHIRELLTRLAERPLYTFREAGADLSLLEAFFAIALPHAFGVRSLSPEVLASYCDLSIQEVYGAVVLPLADEAAVSFNSQAITSRHATIASTACELVAELGIDLGAVAERLVAAAVGQIRLVGITPALHEFAYLSQHLTDSALAIRAAQAAVSAGPNRLSYRVSLSRAYRKGQQYALAAQTAEATLPLLASAEDAASGSRALFTEWGVAEGNLGYWARNCVLAGVALQDMDYLGRLRPEAAAIALSTLTYALRKLWETRRWHALVDGVMACVELGARLNLNARQAAWLTEAEEFAFRQGAATGREAETSNRVLGDALRQALSVIEHPLPAGMPPLRFRFAELARL